MLVRKPKGQHVNLFFWEAEPQTVLEEMSSGRTKPLLCTCSARKVSLFSPRQQTVGTDLLDDFVVKFADSGELTPRGRLCEFTAALLAQYLGVPVVEPAIVTISDEFALILPPTQKPAVKPGNYRHFGSRYLGSGWVIYVPGKQLEKSLLDSALCIYVFDMLIQNGDRRNGKPNVMTDGEALKAYDHELAFPFLFPLLEEKREAWQVQHLKCATNHVFFPLLHGHKLDLEPCIESIRGLKDDIMQISGAIPAEWSSKDLDTIFLHLAQVRDNVDKFADEITRVLK